MSIPELEQQLLQLSPTDKLRIIQLLAQSLNALWSSDLKVPPTSLSEFFRESPLSEAVATVELDLSRDLSLLIDRFAP